jgi:hypothetical protein
MFGLWHAPDGFDFPIPQSANLAGAEACRYTENADSFLRILSILAATVFLNLL